MTATTITPRPRQRTRRPRRRVSKPYGSGDATVAALDNVSVGLARASSRPSWVRPDPGSPPCCTCWPA